MRILVSSNCQTAGITASLRMLLPNDQVEPYPYADAVTDPVHRAELLGQLEHFDVWVVTAPQATIDAICDGADLNGVRIIAAPELYFDAFHPDLVYAWQSGQRPLESASGPYNSAIALWAFRRGLDASQTAELFTPKVFEGLGYTSRWAQSAERLKTDFAVRPGFDYRDFLLPLQRQGVFMHSVNHPRINALAQLARQIARLLDATEAVLAEPIEDFLVDGLLAASFVWPVYPGIADALGLPGSFTWKLGDHRVIRLDEYLRVSFEMYAAVDPSSWVCYEHQWPCYDATLNAALAGDAR